jgi:hypothetical protein
VTTELNTPWVREKLKPFLTKPCVLLNFFAEGITTITVDYAGGMRAAAQHLIQDHTYLDALRENDIPLDENLVSSPCAAQGVEDGIDAINTLLDQRNVSFDAVLANNDDIAVGAIQALQAHRLRVPYDVAVIGFDDKIEAQTTNPPLTSVHAPLRQMGYRAVERVIHEIEGADLETQELIPTHLVHRRSCGCTSESVARAAQGRATFGQRLAGAVIHQGRFGSRICSIARRSAARLAESETAGAEHVDAECLAELLTALHRQMRNPERSDFTRALDLLTNRLGTRDVDVSLTQDVVSTLRAGVLPVLSVRPRYLRKAETIFNEARTFLAEEAVQQQMRGHLEEMNRQDATYSAGQRLMNTFELSELLKLVATTLPTAGISEAYVVLYGDTGPTPEWSRLQIGFDSRSVVELDEDAARFKTSEVLPAAIRNRGQRANFVVWPLRFQGERLGYAVYRFGPWHRGTYQALSTQLSGAIKGALLVKRIQEHSEILSAGIEDLTVTLEEMVTNIESIVNNMTTQAAAVEEGARSVQGMVSNIDTTAEMSSQVRTISESLNNVAGRGNDAARNSIEAVEGVASNSKQILHLVEMIEEVSDRTDILALNAAIQAAHAGEAGKGFSVVAGEIQALSENTKRNLESIRQVVESIVEDINRSAELTRDTVSSLNEILSHATENAQFSTTLNDAMTEQNHDAKEMLKSTEDLVRITKEVEFSLVEQRCATEVFNEALHKLRKLSE